MLPAVTTGRRVLEDQPRSKELGEARGQGQQGHQREGTRGGEAVTRVQEQDPLFSQEGAEEASLRPWHVVGAQSVTVRWVSEPVPTQSAGRWAAQEWGAGRGESVAKESRRAAEGHQGPRPGPVGAVSTLLPGGRAEGRATRW